MGKGEWVKGNEPRIPCCILRTAVLDQIVVGGEATQQLRTLADLANPWRTLWLGFCSWAALATQRYSTAKCAKDPQSPQRLGRLEKVDRLSEPTWCTACN
jgi:hypothetical protein